MSTVEHRILLAAGAFVLLNAAVNAQTDETKESSPFLPATVAQGMAGAGENSSGMPELRGVMRTSAGARYCVYDPVSKHSVWTDPNEDIPLFHILSEQAADDSIVVRLKDGRVVTLQLRSTRTGAAGEGASAAAGSVVAVRPGRLTESQIEWREEIKRRQAENAVEDAAAGAVSH